MAAANPTLDQAKTRVAETVDRLADELERISHQIHANPELCFQEHKASGWLADFLGRQGARGRARGGRAAHRVPGHHRGQPAPAPPSRSWPSTTRCRTSATPAGTT